MSEEYIEEGINGQWTDWKFEAENYKRIYEQLRQENKILKENAEHNDKVVDKVNWENRLLKEVIEEVREFMNDYISTYENDDDERVLYLDDDDISKLLQILDKAKEDK